MAVTTLTIFESQATHDSSRLSARDRKTLLDIYRHGTEPEQRSRAHILLLLDDGISWTVMSVVLYTSASTINRWRQRYLAEGVAVLSGRRAWRAHVREWWLALVLQWVQNTSPTQFGFVRSR